MPRSHTLCLCLRCPSRQSPPVRSSVLPRVKILPSLTLMCPICPPLPLGHPPIRNSRPLTDRHPIPHQPMNQHQNLFHSPLHVHEFPNIPNSNPGTTKLTICQFDYQHSSPYLGFMVYMAPKGNDYDIRDSKATTCCHVPRLMLLLCSSHVSRCNVLVIQCTKISDTGSIISSSQVCALV